MLLQWDQHIEQILDSSFLSGVPEKNYEYEKTIDVGS